MTRIDHFVCFATADREKRNFQVSVRPSLEEDDRTRAAMEDGLCCFSQILLRYLQCLVKQHLLKGLLMHAGVSHHLAPSFV